MSSSEHSAHDLISLAAAAALLYYRTSARPSTLLDPQARADIQRLGLEIASLLPLYHADARPLSDAEREALISGMDRKRMLERPEELAVHTADLARLIEGRIGKAP